MVPTTDANMTMKESNDAPKLVKLYSKMSQIILNESNYTPSRIRELVET